MEKIQNLKYNFDTKANLEIQLRSKNRMGDKIKTKYVPATPNVFRSFHGKRRINGKPFKGQVYCFMTNALYGIDAFADGYKVVSKTVKEPVYPTIRILKRGKFDKYTISTQDMIDTGLRITFRPFGK